MTFGAWAKSLLAGGISGAAQGAVSYHTGMDGKHVAISVGVGALFGVGLYLKQSPLPTVTAVAAAIKKTL